LPGRRSPSGIAWLAVAGLVTLVRRRTRADRNARSRGL
jgi:hypothetical protein